MRPRVRQLRFALLAGLAALALALPARATERFWTNGNGTFIWNDSGNWYLGNLPGSDDIATFDGSAPHGLITLTSAVNIGELRLSGFNYSFSGSKLTLSNGSIWVQGSTPTSQTISTDLGLIASSTFTIYKNSTLTLAGTVTGGATLTVNGETAGNAGTLVLSGGSSFATNLVANDAAAITFSPAAAYTYSGALSGTGSLVKSGAGTLTLSNTNTHSGGTAISAGTLAVSSDANLGAASGAIALSGGGTLRATASFTNDRVTTLGSGGGTIDLATGVALGWGGDISGSGALTKTGSGTLTLSGENSYSGTTTIASGVLQLGGAHALLHSTLDYDNQGGTLSFGPLSFADLGGLSGSQDLALTNTNAQGVDLFVGDNGGSTTYSGILSGAGKLIKTGSGSLTLTGANTHTGYTMVNGGTLILGHSFALQDSRFNGGTLSFGTLTAVTFGGISGSSNLALTNSGGGAVALTLNLPDGASYTYNGALSGAGSLTVSTGMETLSGANTYSGGTTLTSGTLKQGAAGAFVANTAWTVNSGTLDLNNYDLTLSSLSGAGGTVSLGSAALTVNKSSGSATYAGAITGAGGLTKTGTGTLILTGTNTYSGGTTISTGTLQLGNGGPTGTITGNITDNASLAFNYNAVTDFAGVINGTGTVTNIGSNTVRLTGANTFTGPLIIQSGNVAIGNGGTTGSITADVQTAGTLIFNRSTDYTYAGAIGGTGSVFKSGANTLTLTGTNTHTGGTAFGGGTVIFSSLANLGAATGNLTFSGGTLQWAAGNTADISSGRTVTFDNGGATFDLGANNVTLTSAIGNAGAGGLTVAGTGTLTLQRNNTYTGATTVNAGAHLILGLGGTNGSLAGDLVVNGSAVFNRNNTYTYAGALTGSGTAAFGYGDVTLSNPSTSLSGTLAVNAATSTNSPSVALTGVGTTRAATVIVGDSSAVATSDLSVTGSGVTLATDSLTVGSGTHGGQLHVKSGAALTTSTLASVGSGTVTPATVEINGSGSTWTSAVPVTLGAQGVLWAHGGGSVSVAGLDGTGQVILGNGTLALSATDTASNGFALQSGGGTIDVASGQAFTATGIISDQSGANALTKSGTGTLILTGSNTYAGGTTVSAGTLQLGNGGATGAVAGDITDNATVDFDYNALTDFTGVIGGTGGVRNIGSSTVRLTGTNTFTGPLTIVSGNVAIGNGGTGGSIAADVANNGTLIFNRTADYTYAGVISDTGGVYKTNTNTLTLTGANTGTGTLALQSGTLQIGSGGTTGSYAGDIANDASLVFNRSNDLTYSGQISGAGDVFKTGAAKLTLTGTSTGTGTLTLQSGTLQIGSGGATGSYAGDIVNDGALVFNRSADLTYSGAISGPGGVTINGGGGITFNGDNTYTGGTTVNGLLQIGNGGTTGTLTGNVDLGLYGVLNFVRSNDSAFSGGIIGNGQIAKGGAGTLTLTGAGISFTGLTYLFQGGIAMGPGTISSWGQLQASATFTLNAGATATMESILMGNFGNGTLNIGSGAVLNTTTQVPLGTSNHRSGIVNVAGGVWNANGVNVGNPTSIGALNVTAGGVVNTSSLSDAALTVTLDHGTVAFTGATTSDVAWSLGTGGGTISNPAAVTLSGTLGGAGALAKTGSGTLTLTGTNTYTGATSVTAGTLIVDGSVAASSLTTVGSGATLGGSGTVGALTIASGGTLAPGNSPGTLSAGDTTFATGGVFTFQINAATGDPGTNWDLLAISGTLAITATPENPFTIELASLTAGNTAGLAEFFDSAGVYSFDFVTAAGGVTGFSADDFLINTTGFANPFNGTWSVASDGHDLTLDYAGGTAIPEPATCAALGGLAVLGFTLVRRRRAL